MAMANLDYDSYELDLNERELRKEIKKLKKHLKKLVRKVHGSVIQQVARYIKFDTFSQLEINHTKRKISKLLKDFEFVKVQKKIEKFTKKWWHSNYKLDDYSFNEGSFKLYIKNDENLKNDQKIILIDQFQKERRRIYFEKIALDSKIYKLDQKKKDLI